MDRRTDAKIYVFTHKKLNYDLPNNKLYEPLEVGAAQHSEPIAELRDNTGISFSHLNPMIAEGTGLLWIRNNHPEGIEYLGNCQYRRQLRFKENTDFNEIFKLYDAIMPQPIYSPGVTVRTQYANCHRVEDLDICRKIVDKDYPEFREYWDKIIDNGNILFYSTGNIMRTKDYEEMVDFVYGVIEKYYQAIGVNNQEEAFEYVRKNMPQFKLDINADRGYFYQAQTGGFLHERLISLYVLSRFKNILLTPYYKLDGA